MGCDCVIGVDHVVLKNHIVFTCSVMWFFLDCLTLKMKAL
jgi:hypothetical protein